MNKIVIWTLNIVAGIFFFIFFLFLYFPFEPIIQNMLSKVEMASSGKYRITVDEIHPGIILKTRFTNFKWHQIENGKDIILINFDELKVGVHYLPLLANRLEASFVGKSKKGEIEGDVNASKAEVDLNVTISDFPLEEFKILKNYAQADLGGILNGSIKMDIVADQINKNEGKIDLKIKKLTTSPLKIAAMPGFDLDFPALLLSEEKDVIVKMNLAKGKLDIESLNIPGPDFLLDLKGRVMLNKKPNLSRLNVSGNFNISEKLKSAFPIALLIDKQKLEDGSYPLNLSGSVSKPRVMIGTFDLTGMAGGGSSDAEEAPSAPSSAPPMVPQVPAQEVSPPESAPSSTPSSRRVPRVPSIQEEKPVRGELPPPVEPNTPDEEELPTEAIEEE